MKSANTVLSVKFANGLSFFLAQAFTDNVKIQEEEIDSYIWVDLQQARKMCSYDNDLRIIEKAETAIHLLETKSRQFNTKFTGTRRCACFLIL